MQRCLGQCLSLPPSQHNLSFVLHALDRWRCKSLKSRRRQPAQVLQSANALDADQRRLDCAHSSMLPICLNVHFLVLPFAVIVIACTAIHYAANQDSKSSRMDEQKGCFLSERVSLNVWRFSSKGYWQKGIIVVLSH